MCPIFTNPVDWLKNLSNGVKTHLLKLKTSTGAFVSAQNYAQFIPLVALKKWRQRTGYGPTKMELGYQNYVLLPSRSLFNAFHAKKTSSFLVFICYLFIAYGYFSLQPLFSCSELTYPLLSSLLVRLPDNTRIGFVDIQQILYDTFPRDQSLGKKETLTCVLYILIS